MNSKLKHWPVHWKNGMAFSQDHLNSELLAMVDAMKDATALFLNEANFGLLGGDNQRKFSVSFKDNITNEKAEISYCRAITQNGSRIEILDEKLDGLQTPLADLVGDRDLDKSRFWYLILSVDVFTRIPTGEIDESESPRRKPFTRPQYKMALLSENEIRTDSLAASIPLAKFEHAASGLRKVSEYVPPCMRVNSHEALIQQFDAFDQYLNLLKEHAEKIVEKIDYKRRSNQENNRLADDIESLCKAYLEFFVGHYDAFRLNYQDLPPIKVVEFFACMSRVLNHSLDMGYDKTHVLKYFNQYATNMQVTELSELWTKTFQQSYVHYDSAQCFAIIDRFLSSLAEIFAKLTTLDYRELAPRRVVREDTYYDPQRNAPRKDSGRIKFGGSPKSENLGDELYE